MDGAGDGPSECAVCWMLVMSTGLLVTRRHSLTQRGRSNFQRRFPKAAAAMGATCVTPALQQQLTDLGAAHVGYSAMQLSQHSLSIVGARPFSKVHNTADAHPMALHAVIDCQPVVIKGTRMASVDGWPCLDRVAALGKTSHPSTRNCIVSGLQRRQGRKWQIRLQHSRWTMLWSSWHTMAAASWEAQGVTSAAWIGRLLQVCLQAVSRFNFEYQDSVVSAYHLVDPWVAAHGHAGDHGDPDLSMALDAAAEQGRAVAACVFGHMHHRCQGDGALRRRVAVTPDGVLHLNAAVVPRHRVSSRCTVSSCLERVHRRRSLFQLGASFRLYDFIATSSEEKRSQGACGVAANDAARPGGTSLCAAGGAARAGSGGSGRVGC